MSHKLGYVLGSEVTVFTGICVAIQGAPVPISQRGDIGTTGALGGLGAGGRRFRGRLLGIPWTEKRGVLQSMGSQRVRHNSVSNTHTKDSLRTAYMLGESYIDLTK